MAEISPALMAVLIIMIIIVIVIILMLFASRRSSFVPSPADSGAVDNCTEPPVTPINLNLTNPQGDIIIFSWSFVAFATSYVAYLGTTPNFDINDAIQTRISTSNSSSFANLTLGQIYYAKVIARNSCGTSAISTEVNIALQYRFPERFQLRLSINPALNLCDTHDALFVPSDETSAWQFCSISGSYFTYNTSDNTIRQSSRPNYCLIRTNGPNRVYTGFCPSDATSDWQYFTTTKNLCNPNNLNDCLITTSGGSNQKSVGHGSPSSDVVADWNVVAI